MERPRQDLVLGLVFFGALGTLIAATLMLSGISLGEIELRTALFRTNGGLRQGDPVEVQGLRLGQIREIRYDDAAPADRRIVVTLMLDRPVTIRDGYSLTIQEGSVLGGQKLYIDPGPDDAAEVPPEVPLTGISLPGGIEALRELVGDESVQEDFKGILSGLRLAVDRANDGEGTLGQLLRNDTLFVELTDAARLLRENLQQVRDGEGALGRLFWDPTVAEDLGRITGNAATAAENLNDPEAGLLGRLFADAELGVYARDLVADFRAIAADLRAGRGPLGALLADPDVEAELRRITGGTADLVDRANDPEAGIVGALFGDRELRDELDGFVRMLGDVAEELQNGRGLLARLIYDEELGEQLARVLNQVARAIEDAREAAPVATFFTVFQGAF